MQLISMAFLSTVKTSAGLSLLSWSSYFGSNAEKRVVAHSRYPIRPYSANRAAPLVPSSDTNINSKSSNDVEKKKGFDDEEEKLEPLWDDGEYGTQTMRDYLDCAKEMTELDGGPARWFTPISCGPHLRDSSILLFLPGIDGLGLGLFRQHKSLGKVFDVRCMHIPLQDRTPFQELVEWVEETVRDEYASSPKKPIYLVGESLGGCLALAVAARNPHIDLVLILANPATSFGKSDVLLHNLFPFLESLPDQLHVAVPHLLSFFMGDPMKTNAVDFHTVLPSAQHFEQLAGNLAARLFGLVDIIPKDTLLWKLKLLKTAAAYANSRLHAIKAEVLILASGKDNMLPSRDEAWRLLGSLQNCKLRYFKDNGHTILLEDGFNLLNIIKGTLAFRRSRSHDHVMDFLPPSMSEFKELVEGNRWFRVYADPVMLSTMEDGKMVRGLSGVPNEGPVLLVGYHMLLGFELPRLVEQFLMEKKIMVRGVAHPILFSNIVEVENKEFTYFDYMKQHGALPVSATNLFKLFKTKSHIMLFPGGAREALHQKGEEYKLFWPEQPEFVRMAARFGATIVPFGTVGEDDLAEFVLDYDDQMKIPFWSDFMRSHNKRCHDESLNLRTGMSGEVANQPLYLPGLLPKIPGRMYCLFGKPIRTKGRREILEDREKATELYLQVKSQVEANMSYLLEKRREDPYRSIIARSIYRASHGTKDQVPTFDF